MRDAQDEGWPLARAALVFPFAGRDQKPALIISKVSAWRSRCSLETETCAKMGTLMAPRPEVSRSAAVIWSAIAEA